MIDSPDNAQSIASTVEQVFTKIHLENMQGIPILNPRIHVQTLGFQLFEGRMIGIVITPWLMAMIMFQSEDEDWSELALGRKMPHVFPAKKIKFMVNEFDGLGVCQTHSLHSPMNAFSNQQHALAVARDFIDTLLVDAEADAQDSVDENLLGRIMRGEDTPEVNLDDFATIEPHEKSIPINVITERKPVKATFDRRDLLRGRFTRNK